MRKLNLQPIFIPDNLHDLNEDFHEEISNYDDDYADLYLSDSLTDKSMIHALRRIFYSQAAIPLISGSAKDRGFPHKTYAKS